MSVHAPINDPSSDPSDATLVNELVDELVDEQGAPPHAPSGPHYVAQPNPAPVLVPTRRGSRTRVFIALGAIVCALAFVLVRGLGDASQFYRPADEALAQRSSLGTKRFSLIGVVLDGTVKEQGREVSFTIEQNGARIAVRHTGVPPELFRPGMPVLLDGHFSSASGTPVFLSDRMAVKHSSDYKSENPDRVNASAP